MHALGEAQLLQKELCLQQCKGLQSAPYKPAPAGTASSITLQILEMACWKERVVAQGEFEEARSIMKRMGAENKLMHTILVQGRSLFGRLHEAMPSGESTSPRVRSSC